MSRNDCGIIKYYFWSSNLVSLYIKVVGIENLNIKSQFKESHFNGSENLSLCKTLYDSGKKLSLMFNILFEGIISFGTYQLLNYFTYNIV